MDQELFQKNLLKISEAFKLHKRMSEQGSSQDLMVSQPNLSVPDTQITDPEDLQSNIKDLDQQGTALNKAADTGFPVYQHQGQVYRTFNPMFGKGGTSQEPRPLTPTEIIKTAGTNIRSGSGTPVAAGTKMVRESDSLQYRKLIHMVEGVTQGCPVATHDISVNLKNRQTAIDDYHYGPANPNEPGDYWKKAAERWKVSEKIVKTMRCENCAAFDVSDDMRKCIQDGIRGDDTKIADARAPIDLADLGYCTFLKFKCAGKRSCSAWITGGPIVKD